jgi:hypothetical protein
VLNPPLKLDVNVLLTIAPVYGVIDFLPLMGVLKSAPGVLNTLKCSVSVARALQRPRLKLGPNRKSW